MSRNQSTQQEKREYQLAHNVPDMVEDEETKEELTSIQFSKHSRSRTQESQNRDRRDYVNMNAWTNQSQNRNKSRTGRMYDSWYKRKDDEENDPDRPPPSKTPGPKNDNPKKKS